LIRKLIAAMVAAAMLVAMALPAFAQEIDDVLANLALLNLGNQAALSQECVQANLVSVSQEQKNISQSNTQTANGNVVIGGDLSQTASNSNIQAASVSDLTNVCVAEIEQHVDPFGPERVPEPNGAPPPAPAPPPAQ
jgi:Tfp pilus assembly protein FimT